MTASQMCAEVERLITSLLRNKLAIDVGTSMEVRSGNSSIVTWSNQTELSQLTTLNNTIDEYINTLNERWFSAVLFDGAILQLSYTFERNNLKQHRLSFFPCPIIFTAEEIQGLTLQELIEVLDGSEFRERVRVEGPVRFDYDQEAAGSSHPAAHLTVSRASSRVPVAYPMSVGHFVRFVFSHFYPETWESVDELREWACNDWARCLPDTHPHQLYLDWRREC